MGVRARTASQVKTWWSVEDFNYTVNHLGHCWDYNKPGHVRIKCPVIGQPILMYSEEDFDYTVDPLGHCWECNQPGYVKTKCPKLEQSRTSERRRKDEDVCCYNCKECGHYARDCLLPKRTRKEQRSRGVEDEFKRIFWKVMQERNVKPREDPLLSNVRSLQHRVNNLNVDQKKTSYARFKVKQRNIFGLSLIDMGKLVLQSIVSGEFWEMIGGRINRTMDYKVETAEGQNKEL